MADVSSPTERELAILKVLWDRGQASVREVYEVLRVDLPIVQNTVQAFLRTMEEKGQVRHHVEGRTFVYSPVLAREATSRGLVSGLLERMFDGAVDQLVESALSLRKPTEAELTRLKKLVDAAARESAGRSRSI